MWAGRRDLVHYLVELDADTEALDTEGLTPQDLAHELGDEDLEQFLESHAKGRHKDQRSVDMYRRTSDEVNLIPSNLASEANHDGGSTPVGSPVLEHAQLLVKEHSSSELFPEEQISARPLPTFSQAPAGKSRTNSPSAND